ncbi:MAG TPA: hypothetical protein VJT50_08340 [Pyrinomonadaceae bacterium]|nr:hypothetical protein [Pyrinomonadaceae bacterium]
MATAFIFTRQRGHSKTDAVASGTTVVLPQRGQCLLPAKIIPKQKGHATVAKREPQNLHTGSAVSVAAPQLGQLSVSACISGILAGAIALDYAHCL